jgi:hypothetical protein
MNALERRCRVLLRAYPRWYRGLRGEEMLATLIEASESGQKWPSARDARALIIGGLRVRAAQDQRLTTGANLRLAAQLGAALTLLLLAADNLSSTFLILTHIYAQQIGIGYWLVSGLLGLAAVAAAWFAPRPAVAAIAAAAAASVIWVYWSNDRALAILPAGLLGTLAVLVFLGERMPRSWLWLAGAFFAWNVLQALTPLSPLFHLYVPLIFAFWIILGIVVLWAVVDARPAMAVAIYIGCTYVISQLLGSIGYGAPIASAVSWPMLGYAIIAAVLASGSFWRLRRQAVL